MNGKPVGFTGSSAATLAKQDQGQLQTLRKLKQAILLLASRIRSVDSYTLEERCRGDLLSA